MDNRSLWEDEADTVFFSRSIARTGFPTAYDGRNVAIYDNCSQLSDNLLSKKIPWAQYYVSFLSEKIFGRSTAGMRALFVLLGSLSLFPLALLMRTSGIRWPWLLSAFLLLLPQTFLFLRNARYFPLVILETLLLAWLCLCPPLKSRSRYSAYFFLSALFFHTHPLSAAFTLAGLTLFKVVRDRKECLLDVISLWSGIFVWALWYFSLSKITGQSDMFTNMIWKSGKSWVEIFGLGLRAGISDFDYVGLLPCILLGGCLVASLFYHSIFKKFLLDPLNLLILCLTGCLIAGTALTIGVETPDLLSALRYMPQLCLLLPLLFFSWLKFAPERLRIGFMVLMLFGFLTNWLSLGYWLRNSPTSWWPTVYREVFHPIPDATQETVKILAQMSKEKTDPLIRVIPDFQDVWLMVYGGDRFLVAPTIEKETPCAEAVQRIIGAETLKMFDRKPDYLLILESNPQFREEKSLLTVPSFFRSPDSNRPELTRRGKDKGHPVVNFQIIQ